MLLNIIKRLLRRVFTSLIGLYAPPAIIITYAVIQINLFPAAPLWLVPVFAIVVIYIFSRYVKW